MNVCAAILWNHFILHAACEAWRDRNRIAVVSGGSAIVHSRCHKSEYAGMGGGAAMGGEKDDLSVQSAFNPGFCLTAML
jgi:hypothetical protein